jgi:hypothetical protein
MNNSKENKKEDIIEVNLKTAFYLIQAVRLFLFILT